MFIIYCRTLCFESTANGMPEKDPASSTPQCPGLVIGGAQEHFKEPTPQERRTARKGELSGKSERVARNFSTSL